MNIGSCPYPDCGGVLALEVPERTPVYALVDCEHCKREVWYRFSRVDPEAWTREEFEATHVIDHATKTIKPIAVEKSFRQPPSVGEVDSQKA